MQVATAGPGRGGHGTWTHADGKLTPGDDEALLHPSHRASTGFTMIREALASTPDIGVAEALTLRMMSSTMVCISVLAGTGGCGVRAWEC